MALLRATFEALQRRGQLKFKDVSLLTRMVNALICKLTVIPPTVRIEIGNPMMAVGSLADDKRI